MLNVGDKVRIRKDLQVGEIYGILSLTKEANRFLGEEDKVVGVTPQGNYELVRNGFVWSEEMLERVDETPETEKEDVVNHPSHYTQGKIECIDYIIDKKLSYCLGNAVKYITRCELKNGGQKRIEDLEKAVFYVKKQIEIWRNEK
jgi:hypothetical protein